ncbi:MAG: hypothetical protein AAB953_03275 [Patescibacteria group bacterium]
MLKTKTKNRAFINSLAIFLLIFGIGNQLVFAVNDDTPPSLNIDTGSGSDNDSPPSIVIDMNGNNNGNAGNSDNTKIKITKADAFPKGFNPTVTNTKITYAINKEAIIEIKIVDSSGQTVVKLIDDKKISKGEYFVNWYGTTDNEEGGPVVKTGTYQYKILAKNTQTKAVEDTADDEINLIYFTLEDMPKDDGKSDEVVNKDQADATMTLNNSKSGKTAETGPGVIIYSIFPIIGYFLSRKKHD